MNRRKAIKSILTSSIGLTTLGFWSTNSSFLEELPYSDGHTSIDSFIP